MTNGPLLMHTMVDDQQRLAAVRRTGLLDAPNEERFDRLTRLACRLLRVPIALVSLMDADRQFYVIAGCEFQARQNCLRLIKVYTISFIP
jgi:hypothetical protein